MPVSVTLEFIPPDEPDLKALHVYESPTQTGTFTEIDSTLEIAAYPNWISRYTTALATSITDWFAIAWENTAGVTGQLSAPLQGGSTTLVSEIINRVMIRNPSLNQIIVGQEAQAVVSEYMHVDDPNFVAVSDASYVEIRGMTNMTLARSLIATVFATGATSTAGFTAGLVSIKSSTGASADPTKAIEALVKSANADLGTSESIVLLMADVSASLGCRPTALTGVDLSRSVAMIDYGEVNA
jgi:hypothetical protein